MSNNNTIVNENVTSGPGAEIADKITAQGDKVRQLKSDKKPKEEIDAAVKLLLSLKVLERNLHINEGYTIIDYNLTRMITRRLQDLIGNQQAVRLQNKRSLPRSQSQRKR